MRRRLVLLSLFSVAAGLLLGTAVAQQEETYEYVVKVIIQQPGGPALVTPDPPTIDFHAALTRAQQIAKEGFCTVRTPVPGVRGDAVCLPPSQVLLVRVADPAELDGEPAAASTEQTERK